MQEYLFVWIVKHHTAQELAESQLRFSRLVDMMCRSRYLFTTTGACYLTRRADVAGALALATARIVLHIHVSVLWLPVLCVSLMKVK